MMTHSNMDAIRRMVDEAKILRRHDRRKIIDDIEDEYPNANQQQIEEKADDIMKESYVDTFIHLFQRNVSFCWDLFDSELGQRVLEQRERLLREEDTESDDEEDLLMASVTLSREHIEDLF